MLSATSHGVARQRSGSLPLPQHLADPSDGEPGKCYKPGFQAPTGLRTTVVAARMTVGSCHLARSVRSGIPSGSLWVLGPSKGIDRSSRLSVTQRKSLKELS